MRPLTLCLLFVATAAAAQDGPLPDVSTMIQTGRCETPPVDVGNATAVGADQTYTGSLTAHADGRVTGIEQRHISPNTTWATTTALDGTRGQACVVTWTVEGRTGPPQSCRDCDVSISFEANLDPARSTCNQRLMADGAHFRGSNDVKKSADGTLQLFFSRSGNPLGTGRWTNDQMVWASAHKCIWM